MRSRPFPRLALALALAPLLGLGAAAVAGGCGTDAVGVDACKQIETARCDSLQSCGGTVDDTDKCNAFYRDECLHGIENKDHAPSDVEAKACVAAIKAVAVCATTKIATLDACTGVPIDSNAAQCGGVPNAKLAPCDVVKSCPQVLQACAFVAAPPAIADAGSDASSDAGDGGDAGDAADGN